jgi:hypothetical protein
MLWQFIMILDVVLGWLQNFAIRNFSKFHTFSKFRIEKFSFQLHVHNIIPLNTLN